METELETGNEESSPPGVPGEHCYCKYPPPSDRNLPDQSPEGSGPISPSLTSLDKTQDNFESVLLLLLQAYTVHSQPGCTTTPGELPISSKALDTLSSEQIKALITSNSVNYEVIQQILAQQKGRPAVVVPGSGRPHSILCRTPSLEDSLVEDSSKSPTPSSVHSPPSLPSIADTNQQLQQLIQITPQQLQVLQLQVNDLLKSQHISLPPDLSPEQQQQLIQTLLLRQLHLQQAGGVATISLKDGSMAMKQLLASSTGQGKDQGQETSSKGWGLSVADALQSVGSSGRGSVNGSGDKGGSVGDARESGRGTQPKKITASKFTSLSGAAISAQQAASRAMGRGRGRRKAAAKGAAATGAKSTGPGRKKKEANTMSALAKNDLKKPPMPYNLFFREVYSTVMATNSEMGFSDVSKIISMMWSAMGADVKKRYYDEHEKLKAEHKAATDEEAAKVGSPGGGGEGLSIRSLIAGPVVSAGSSALPSGEPNTPVVAEENLIVVSAPTPLTEDQSASQATPVVVENKKRTVSVEALCPVKDPKLCANYNCENVAVFLEDRGPRYCSNGCVVNHCRKVFDMYFTDGKILV